MGVATALKGKPADLHFALRIVEMMHTTSIPRRANQNGGFPLGSVACIK